MRSAAIGGRFGCLFTEGVVGGAGGCTAQCGAGEQAVLYITGEGECTRAGEQAVVVVGVVDGICSHAESCDLEVVVVGASHSARHSARPGGTDGQEAIVGEGEAAAVRGGDAGQLAAGGVITITVVTTWNGQCGELAFCGIIT